MMVFLGGIIIFVGGMQLINGSGSDAEAMKTGLTTVAIGMGFIYVASL